MSQPTAAAEVSVSAAHLGMRRCLQNRVREGRVGEGGCGGEGTRIQSHEPKKCKCKCKDPASDNSSCSCACLGSVGPRCTDDSAASRCATHCRQLVLTGLGGVLAPAWASAGWGCYTTSLHTTPYMLRAPTHLAQLTERAALSRSSISQRAVTLSTGYAMLALHAGVLSVPHL